MKRIITLVIAFICCSAFAQQTNLSQMTEEARNEYLTKLAKEVTENIGPGWLQGEVSVTISPLKVFDGDGDTREHIKALLGRKYYEVRIIYDEKTRKEVGWEYASEVRIWEDSGEPIDVIYGHNYGRHFLDKPYKEFVKEGIGPKDQVKFEEMYIPEWAKFRLMTEEERKEYLIKKAIEVTQNFGPGWYRESVIPIVSDQKVFDESMIPKSQPNVRKYIGRKYYIVRLDFDEETRKKYVWSHASEVRIWADDGEPFMVTFGNTYGVHFYSKPYYQWLEDGIGDEYKNFFDEDEYTMEAFRKRIQPMIEMVEAAKEARSRYLSNMTEEERNEYLLKKSKEAIMYFGPEWYQEPMSVEISGPHKLYGYGSDNPYIQQWDGRLFYSVVYSYDKYKKYNNPDLSYAFEVSIWEDDAEPWDISFGNEFGITFFPSYKELVKEGVKKEYQMPFDKAYYNDFEKLQSEVFNEEDLIDY